MKFDEEVLSRHATLSFRVPRRVVATSSAALCVRGISDSINSFQIMIIPFRYVEGAVNEIDDMVVSDESAGASVANSSTINRSSARQIKPSVLGASAPRNTTTQAKKAGSATAGASGAGRSNSNASSSKLRKLM